ncbi:MAG TPA: ribosome small subunit-dependent GTPase A [Syntrophales bacterium]|nr:ribosome small subunit-dependent GTPase A [Syntrophales bacterium]
MDMRLSDLGFDEWFEPHVGELHAEGRNIARISAVDRGGYLVRNESGEIPAELAGRLSWQIDDSAGLPCVGDWVTAEYYNHNTEAIIHGVFPRKTFLRRKTAGDRIDYQMIAANIDTAFLVQSCHFDFNPRRLDRYLVMAAEGHVEPVVILTKTDLITGDELEEKIALVRSVTQAQVLTLSNKSVDGLEPFQQTLLPGRTYCLLGSSGVGKTTLINRLLGRDALSTKAVSGTGEGTHTTSRRQLVVLAEGAMLIDTPGMRELGLLGAGEGIGIGFEDIVRLAATCRYADCSHENEPGCAVRAAIESGKLSSDRYANYLKLKKETDYHDMSYLDKRKKDRAFGRFVKSVKKNMKEK